MLDGFNTMRVMKIPFFVILHTREYMSSSRNQDQTQRPDLKLTHSNPLQQRLSQTVMAPSRKATIQKMVRATRTPPTTPRNPNQSKRRSASPPNQHTPIRIRNEDEPPARSTRSWVSAPPISNITPSASQRTPIDCPFVGCLASTVHQHLPQLQYRNARPGRTVHYRGYGNSSRDMSSRPSLVVTHPTARHDNGISLKGGTADAGNDEVVEPEPETEKRGAVLAVDETAPQNQLTLKPEQTAAKGE